jgi:protein SCO1/2
MRKGTSRSLSAASAIPGTPLPDFQLTDQDNRPLTGRSFSGRVLVVTFIYTRCPLPDFCPLMVSHLERLRRQVNERGAGANLSLLGITLDPAYDAPAVLRAYGESVLKGSDRFDQWTLATGSAAQIQTLARFFGVDYRQESGLITHTLATAVVGKDGRVMRVLPSNSWLPDDLIRVVEQGIETPAEAPGE